MFDACGCGKRRPRTRFFFWFVGGRGRDLSMKGPRKIGRKLSPVCGRLVANLFQFLCLREGFFGGGQVSCAVQSRMFRQNWYFGSLGVIPQTTD